MLTTEQTGTLVEHLKRQRADLAYHERARSGAAEGEAPQIGPLAHAVQADDAPEAEMISDDEARLAGHDDTELGAVDRALGRLEIGEADICVVCGTNIPYERLLANPTAGTCIDCQRDIERVDALANPGAEPTM